RAYRALPPPAARNPAPACRSAPSAAGWGRGPSTSRRPPPARRAPAAAPAAARPATGGSRQRSARAAADAALFELFQPDADAAAVPGHVADQRADEDHHPGIGPDDEGGMRPEFDHGAAPAAAWRD